MSWTRTTTRIVRNRLLTPIPFSKSLHSHCPQRLAQSPAVYDVPQAEEPLPPSEPPRPSSRNGQISRGKKLQGSKSYKNRRIERIRPFEAKPQRALFYVPGSSQKMIDKAWTLDVDNIVYALRWRSVDYRHLI